MTLAEFSRAVGASPRWVLNNTPKRLGADRRYSVEAARQLSVARALQRDVSMPIAKAMLLARDILRGPCAADSPVEVRLSDDGDVVLKVDLYRVLSSFHVRLAEMRASFAPRARGRPRTRSSDPVAAAFESGLDLSLIRDNLRKTRVERLRQLDAMGRFSADVRRSGSRSNDS